MTDTEYDIIDELYFVTPYESLRAETEFSDEELKTNLITLVEKGWVKVYLSVDQEAEEGAVNLNESFASYHYLASKKGLFEHNTR